MELNITIPDSMKLPTRTVRDFLSFLRRMGMRIAVGHIRYGEPDRRKRYMYRMKKELAAYKKSGNLEHLYNLANYAFLESVEPEHMAHHFDGTVESATRKQFDWKSKGRNHDA